MKKLLKRFIVEEEGQTATEYMLIIGVIVVGIIVAAKIFLGKFKGGMKDMGAAIGEIFKSSSSKLKGLKD
jgi:Flp pilus assembly pilin Flp